MPISEKRDWIYINSQAVWAHGIWWIIPWEIQ